MTEAAQMPDRSTSGFNPGIHGARGLFCLFVVLYHVWNSGLPRWPVPEVVNQAMESLRYGVELFFAISGFVIFKTMRPVLEGIRSPLDFIINRATRIFPVLWVTIIVFLPLAIVQGQGPVTTHLTPVWLFGLKLFGNFLALGPVLPVPVFYGVAWTIGFEFTFYTLCFAYLTGRFYFRINLALPIILIGLCLIAYHPRALFFLSGILVAQGLFKGGMLRHLAIWPWLWLGLFLLFWHNLAAPQPPFFPDMVDWNLTHDWPLGLSAFASLTLGIAAIARGDGVFCRFLMTPPMKWLGTISYSLYLWHAIVLGVVKFVMAKLGLTAMSGNGAQLILLFFALPLSLWIAHASQCILEQRFTGWLRRNWLRPTSQATPMARRA